MNGDSGSESMRLASARLIDTGAEAEIFEWGAGRVLRLLPAATPESRVTQEVAVMRAVVVAGVPAPAVHGVVNIDGRPGIVLDRVDGGPMLDVMLKRPWRLLSLVRRFGQIQAGIHATEAPAGLPTVHEQVTEQLDRLGPELASLKTWAKAELNLLPGGDALLHGDYHPLNLLMQGSVPLVIDWPGASAGPQEADLARTRLLIEAADPPNGSPVMLKLMGAFRTKIFLPRYLSAYGRAQPFDRRLVERWLLVRAAERLAEGPPNEHATLLRLLREGGAPVYATPPP